MILGSILGVVFGYFFSFGSLGPLMAGLGPLLATFGQLLAHVGTLLARLGPLLPLHGVMWGPS